MKAQLGRQSGMTLIEVMAALVIFALAGTAVMKSAAEHLSSVSQVEEVTFATWVANNRLNEMKLTGTWPPKNNQRGTMEMADRTWYWQQVVTKTTDDDLRAVEVNVGQDPQYEYFQANVITYVSKPASIAQDATININGSGGSNNNQNGTDP
ncbi:type II secretion system minor pseudopilin GspI [Alteromonas confluentis]|uniref:Type II secretion system protein I n=1 Tax=Alteromonas confluentis TaxID=1656094 RepID=A0A1E7ZDV7_9ALTE|nr:type II secretion system minor pseudopilin GspI [Alteromonas confluentis]OFC71644.1 type II secretion system protein GspI [Alteromonas confluentis]